ncbi:MAG: hypothetical protein A3B91_00210 [Candidatus Yanofskybacteria bacterium RIFCSPHIGHO2_02_FULL_41_29]|uniref:Phosphoribosyltransferase domain-containing protein n=1 Tax=Candidatus Yanofskybacteria bacterium RIFCSPHIGHO2_01_FULL_41_53 TaxID=1802663 RepID=A0A1F8EJA8_9BACT|nr:MAG: hypothetical protein A2650_03265 [Candidatus Yanofskybacteria bacterium RIFCSPHIGHO2_01_FULL_41_53]OGN10546.1 MAG: hypothetical protein A3B91_00210 [Candidatus Yanofskybacteria bacterium RIFCSPHIGHO2_02_FULL_41_29]OGN17948.1 MAG: hypothetical protein A3F48_04570 [Candidatus Yanofskybacteria bacterium RIFCSPHIGHO2_12_FULL_41_9]OGN21693.1 MAG: hypothetical protein A2916_03985 [Candidatus Yanofskybacteria bacterium RIFCSPLOWO2_01_FULL_41_67]OGN29208.1 MAG: hypothetical protein A3H54_03460 
MKKEFYSWNQFEKDCNKLAKLVKKSKQSLKAVYGIPRGGLTLAVRLSHKLELPLIVDGSLVNRSTLIVDDIADSGKTLILFCGKNKYITATLFYSPNSDCKPTYFSRKKEKWVVFPWEEEKTSKYDKTKV